MFTEGLTHFSGQEGPSRRGGSQHKVFTFLLLSPSPLTSSPPTTDPFNGHAMLPPNDKQRTTLLTLSGVNHDDTASIAPLEIVRVSSQAHGHSLGVRANPSRQACPDASRIETTPTRHLRPQVSLRLSPDPLLVTESPQADILAQCRRFLHR